jgi:hypothetical protein
MSAPTVGEPDERDERIWDGDRDAEFRDTGDSDLTPPERDDRDEQE